MTDTERGFLLTSMSDYAVARVLRRSLAWVQRERAVLAGAEPIPAKPRPQRDPSRNVAPVIVLERAEKPAPRPPYVVPPRTARFALWFLRAGWPPREVAWLFDQPPRDLEALMGGAG